MMQKDGREFLLQKIDIPRELIETKMCTKFERERFRIEGEKLNFKLLEFSNSWNGIVSGSCFPPPVAAAASLDYSISKKTLVYT